MLLMLFGVSLARFTTRCLLRPPPFQLNCVSGLLSWQAWQIIPAPSPRDGNHSRSNFKQAGIESTAIDAIP